MLFPIMSPSPKQAAARRLVGMIRRLLPALLASASISHAADMPAGITKFLKERCADCHDAETKKGNLDLTALKHDDGNAENFAVWVKVHDRVEAGEMPPKKKEQPPAAERSAFMLQLGDTLRAVERANSLRHTVRRMNRDEYEGALRDLLALPLLRVKEMLPEDGRQLGFDKAAGALEFSQIQMAKYLQAADFALRQAIVKGGVHPETKTWRENVALQNTARGVVTQKCGMPILEGKMAPGVTLRITGNPVEDHGNSYLEAFSKGDAPSFVVLTSVIGHHQPEGLQIDRFNPPVPGWYRVRFSIWAMRWERDKVVPPKRGLVQVFASLGKPFFKDEKGQWQATPLEKEKVVRSWMENVEFHGEGEATHVTRASLKGQPIGYFDAPPMMPTTHEFKVWLNPGEKISFHAMTLPSTPGTTASVEGRGMFDYEGPGIAYDWFEVEGPLIEDWPPMSQQRLFGKNPPDANPVRSDQRALLTDFVGRALRRPVTDGDLAPYVAMVESKTRDGASFEQAMLAAYKAVLCSPDFLFIGIESRVPASAQPARLGEHPLASRLSFFLWDSVPDAELLALADKRELSKPDVLKKQVVRMLADPRSERFVAHFLDEWLELAKIDFTSPDPNLYPEFDTWLHDSMLAETRASFRRLLSADLGVHELVASDKVLVNQRLAELYGIRGVSGADLREVKVPEDNPRGGFLTQAAILKVTANGTATSPVLRGAWVTERLLGIPREPPPPNVPAIEPDASGATTIRQLLDTHRADASCAGCHARIDPPGFALENFDAIGGWREHYRLGGQPKKVRQGKVMIDEPFVEVVSSSGARNRTRIRTGGAVDASGQLADGRRFEDIRSFRALLLENEDALARNLARQLLIYGTGNAVRFGDRPEIESILAKTKSAKHGVRSVLQEVVASALFVRP